MLTGLSTLNSYTRQSFQGDSSPLIVHVYLLVSGKRLPHQRFLSRRFSLCRLNIRFFFFVDPSRELFYPVRVSVLVSLHDERREEESCECLFNEQSHEKKQEFFVICVHKIYIELQG